MSERAEPDPYRIFARQALLPHGWANDVVLTVRSGLIEDVEEGACAGAVDETHACVVPAMPNLHSHAFQWAMAGLAERRGHPTDSFWTWRETMYDFALRLTARQVEVITRQLYIEMLRAGYGAVGEFHYLHHTVDGSPYGDLAELSLRTLRAAEAAGIVLCHLPVLYSHGGFGQEPATGEQRRFINDLSRFASLVAELRTQATGRDDVRIGVALHSLRAVAPEQLSEAVAVTHDAVPTAPVHIHIAEQTAEVEACMACHGQRPVRWLLDHANVDQRWCLVHATHLDDDELAQLSSSGAVVGLCPTTEANLGDGVFRAHEFLAAGGAFGVGSDSHITVDPFMELRVLEYSQRLWTRRRTVLTHAGQVHNGSLLWSRTAEGGARALGLCAGALASGHRADLVVLDDQHLALLHRGGAERLDAAVFAANQNPVRHVMVGGQWRIREGVHALDAESRSEFDEVMRELLVQ